MSVVLDRFSNVYAEVEKDSNKTYNLQFHQHVYKYKELRAFLPPPFNLLHVIEFVCLIPRKFQVIGEREITTKVFNLLPNATVFCFPGA